MADMDTAAPDWVRLAEFVQRYREIKGLSLSRAAAEAGIDRGSWGKIEKAESRPQGTTLRAIERVLGWSYGSAQRVLDGGDPELAADGPRAVPPALEQWVEMLSDPTLTAEQRARIEAVLKAAANLVVAPSTGSAKRAIS